jgi:hypothetical protein
MRDESAERWSTCQRPGCGHGPENHGIGPRGGDDECRRCECPKYIARVEESDTECDTDAPSVPDQTQELPSRMTFTRPGTGHGPAHHETVEVVPVAEYEALASKYQRLSAMWKDSETRVDLANRRAKATKRRLLDEREKVREARLALEVLRVAAHGHVQVIRGMCTDEVDHREIDRALVRLDDVINPAEPSPSNTDAVRTPTRREEQT